MGSAFPGKVMTVLGPVDPEDLGPTMTHEHIFIDFTVVFTEPEEATRRRRAWEPVTLENLGWVRYHQTSNWDNLLLNDEETALAEVLAYKQAGGGTLVDATTRGIGRDPEALARIARATGVHILCGTGYYIAKSHPKEMDARTEEDLAREMVREITEGVGETGIRCGLIGEIGCSWPLHPNEAKVLRASARAQQETGCAILVHPGRDESAPFEILAILKEAGADLSRVILGHIDRTVFSPSRLRELAETGCYLEYDLFGQEVSYYPFNPAVYMRNDEQRIQELRQLRDWGFLERIVVAQDICMKIRLLKYGGHGYGHILENIVPRMRRRGFSEAEVRTILVENPARVLTFP